jgi:hypothetical protein
MAVRQSPRSAILDPVTELTPTSQRNPAPPPLRPLDRVQRERLRRGELDADVVTAWMERTRGLAAPPAPPTGELAPNGCGWLLGVGSPEYRFYPRFWQWSRALSGGFPGIATALGSEMGIHSIPALIAMGVAPMIALLSASSLCGRTVLGRRWSQASRPARLAEVRPGTLVRVAGVVAEQPTVSTLFRGIPAVLFRNRIGGADETRGIDFVLDLPGGERVQIRARSAALLDTPRVTHEPPACGPVAPELWGRGGALRLRSTLMTGDRVLVRAWRRGESSVGPGDQIEVCGVLDHEEAPDRASAFDRHFPVAVVIRSTGAVPLLVRSAPLP